MSRTGDRDIQAVMVLSIKLKALQDEIRAKQEEEAKLKADLRALLKTDEHADVSAVLNGPGPGRGPRVSGPRSDSLAKAIVETIDAEPTVDFTPDMVKQRVAARGFGSDTQTIRSTLARLAREERIGKAGHGHYKSVHRAAKASGLNGAVHHDPAVVGEEVGQTH